LRTVASTKNATPRDATARVALPQLIVLPTLNKNIKAMVVNFVEQKYPVLHQRAKNIHQRNKNIHCYIEEQEYPLLEQRTRISIVRAKNKNTYC